MYKVLDSITDVEDLKKLHIDDLKFLAKDIRKFLINSVSLTGGHLASNLGVVELTIALHYCFDSPVDKIVYDVGHQSYIHKILTGRKDSLDTIRQYDGLSGFPKRSESVHDAFNTGHSSTSISAALGMAMKRDLFNEDNYVVSVIGDGSLTGGIAIEALNNAVNLDSNFIVIINDNQMSISENVGGISCYLDSIRTATIYNDVKDDVQRVLKKIPRVGENLIDAVRDVKDGIKQMIIPDMFFEEMGFTYLGPIDGNNIKQLIMTLNHAKRVNKPIIIHINTVKGKGYPFAERFPSKYHGVKPFDKATGKPLTPSPSNTFSNVFGTTLVDLASENKDIVAITAAMPNGTGLSGFKKLYPDRFFDVGIAEQHAVTFAAGLAVSGLKPFIGIYSSFLQRAYDQVIHDVALQKLPVVFGIDRSGIVGEDGETHQGVFDTAFLNHIPNMTIMAPKDGDELREMLVFAKDYNSGPIAIKYPKGEAISNIEDIPDNPITYGEFEVIRQGKKVAILAIGSMVNTAYDVYERLVENGHRPTLINLRFIKPYNKERLLSLLENHKHFVVIEESTIIGGFGSELIRLYNGKKTRVLTCGIEDEFITHGKRTVLLDKCNLSADKLFDKITEFIDKK